MAYKIGYHRTLKYKFLREIIRSLCRLENININEYNIFNMRSYLCSGKDLQGENVKYNILDNCSCWVDNNDYAVIEIPKSSNKGYMFGEFLVYARNKTQNYYIFGIMNYNIENKKTTKTKKYIDSVSYKCFGKYQILKNTKTIIKNQDGEKINDGGNLKITFNFDCRDLRKFAYGKNGIYSNDFLTKNKENTIPKCFIKGLNYIKKYQRKYKYQEMINMKKGL